MGTSTPAAIRAPRKRRSDESVAVVGRFVGLLDDVSREAMVGNYSADLRGQAESLTAVLKEHGQAIRSEDELAYFKGKALLAEIHDYFGDLAAAKAITFDAAELFLTLRGARTVPEDRRQREILREKVRLCLNHVQAFDYRHHRYGEAYEKMRSCLEFVRDHLRRPDMLCDGTLGQIHYYMGRTLRQMHDYDAAEQRFGEALDCYHRRARRLDDSDVDGQQFVNYRIAVCLGLGLAWVKFTRGALRQALFALYPARMLLRDKAPINRAYADLIYGSIRRALAAGDATAVGEANAALQEAYAVFKTAGHTTYKARAAYQLALSHFHSGPAGYDWAAHWLQEVRAIAEANDDVRWRCHALVLESRILREKGMMARAEGLAREALASAESRGQRALQIESLIALSEARTQQRAFRDAREHLQRALELTTSTGAQPSFNPKTEAVCRLHLSRVYAGLGEGDQALRMFKVWEERLRDVVEHHFVHKLAREVAGTLAAINVPGRDFVIKAGDRKALNYRTQLAAMRSFLLDQARGQAKSKVEIAELLGISRQALHEWPATPGRAARGRRGVDSASSPNGGD